MQAKTNIKFRLPQSLILIGLMIVGLFSVNLGLSNTPPQQIPLLSAEEAFQWRSLERIDQQTLVFSFHTAPGYYLYRDRFSFRVLSPNHSETPIQLGLAQFPRTTTYKLYSNGKKMPVFSGDFSIPVPLLILNATTPWIIEISYQGCSEADLCYPAITQRAVLTAAINTPAEISTPISAPINASMTMTDTKTQTPSLWGLFGLGILLSLTPCVWPMLPILLGIIVGTQASRGRAFLLSLCYVLAMATCYAVIGLVAAYAGKSLQVSLQTPWVVISFSVILIFMGLGLFGLFTIELPAALRQLVARLSQAQRSGDYWGAAVMGALSTLILSPCATPALAGAIVYLAETGHVQTGALGLFLLGLGMGLPLLLIGALGAQILPKAGSWMNGVKIAMAWIMLGLSLYVISRLVAEPYRLGLWALWNLGISIQLILSCTRHIRRKLIKLMFFLSSIILIINATSLGLRALGAISTPIASRFQIIYSPADWQAIKDRAKRENKPIFLDIYAKWCISCEEMERQSFNSLKVRTLLQHFLAVRADVTANTAANQALLHELGVIAPPTLLFFTPNGVEIKQKRQIGFLSADELAKHLIEQPD